MTLGTEPFSAPAINHYHQLITGLASVRSTHIFTTLTYASHRDTLLFKTTIIIMRLKKLRWSGMQKTGVSIHSEAFPAKTQFWKYPVFYTEQCEPTS